MLPDMQHLSIEIINSAQMHSIALLFAKKMLSTRFNHARVIALVGNLGAGKTTFVQGFARALGIKGHIKSPTFVLMNIFSLEKQLYLNHMVHIDAYRVEKSAEMIHLGFRELLNDRDAVILVEWADKIKNILPKDTIWIYMYHGHTSDHRLLKIQTKNKKFNFNFLVKAKTISKNRHTSFHVL